MSNVIAIVGRPNVGKSTLFNRFTEAKHAIIDDISGVTRDRIYGTMEWEGKSFSIIDTGGYVAQSDDIFETAIREQVEIAIEEADQIIFLVDVTTGITNLDDQINKMLRKTKKPVYLVVNKVDNSSRQLDATEFYSLGKEEIYNLSAMNGSGTGELLDAMVKNWVPEKEQLNEIDIPKLAILGRPNVGKSSLVNALIGKTHNIVTNIAGTTRDAIHTHYKLFGKEFMLIDTAGIRKKAKVHENLEFYSVLRAIKCIEQADVCLIMIDATQGIESQDINILRLALKRRKGILILVNKWDLIKDKETNLIKEFEEKIREKTAPFVDYPIVFISALTKQRIHKAIESALEIAEKKNEKISTSILNDTMLKVVAQHTPAIVKGKQPKIKYVTQLPTQNKSFAFFCSNPKYIKADYKQYLENSLRKHFDLHGLPINIFFKDK